MLQKTRSERVFLVRVDWTVNDRIGLGAYQAIQIVAQEYARVEAIKAKDRDFEIGFYVRFAVKSSLAAGCRILPTAQATLSLVYS